MAEQQFAPSTTSAPTIPAITLNGVEVDFPNSDTSFSVKDLDSISKSPKLTVGGTSSQVVKLEPRTSDEKREREKVRHEDVAEKSVQDPERGRHIQTEQRNRQRRHSVHDVSREPLPSPSFGSLTKDVPKRQMPPTRQSASSKIPSLRIIDKTSEGGWRVKIRTMFSPRPVSRINVDIILVYVYSTSMENARGTDADTTLFTHRGESNKTASTPIPSIQRARTAQVPDTRRSRSSPFAPTLDTSKSTLLPTSIKDLPTRNVRRQHPSPERPTSKESQRPRNQVSWLSSPDMLPKQFPRGRVTTVGLDLSTAASTPLDFESAANQFLNCVAEIRKEKSQTPVLLLGHTYGGILIIQSLVKIAQQGSDARLLLEKVAGVFLFSCTHIHSTKYSQLLADLLNEKPTAGVFSSVVDGMPNLARLAQTFRTTIFQSRYTSRAKHPNPSERGPETDFEEIKLAFPIVQFVTNAEKPDPQKPPKDSSTDFLKLPTRTITLEKDFSNALLFTASTDSDFLRLMLLMHSGLRTHQFLYTVVNDGYREVQKMIRDGYNVNIRDRWYVYGFSSRLLSLTVYSTGTSPHCI